jgi:co-chaperonin GroES (HSP10)
MVTSAELQSLANFEPIEDRVVALHIPAGETAGGIALPDDAEMGIDKFLVLKCGPGRVCEYNPQSGLLPMNCEPGDVVRVKGGEITSFHLGRERYCMFQSWQIVSHAPLEKVGALELADIIAGAAKPKLLKV